MLPERAQILWKATGSKFISRIARSSRNRKDLRQDICGLRQWLSILNSICNNTQRQNLHMRYRLGMGRTIGQYARQVRNLTQPPAIFFLLSFYGKRHSLTSNHTLHLD